MNPGPHTTLTHYEFISHSGTDDATAKQKLKTVRSHVMRNYLHQQQQRSGVSSNPVANERRQSKQRTRSSRSNSQETDKSLSPTLSIRPHDQVSLGFVGSFDTKSNVTSAGKQSTLSTRSVLALSSSYLQE